MHPEHIRSLSRAVPQNQETCIQTIQGVALIAGPILHSALPPAGNRGEQYVSVEGPCAGTTPVMADCPAGAVACGAGAWWLCIKYNTLGEAGSMAGIAQCYLATPSALPPNTKKKSSLWFPEPPQPLRCNVTAMHPSVPGAMCFAASEAGRSCECVHVALRELSLVFLWVTGCVAGHARCR